MKVLEKIITKELLRKVLPKETEKLTEDFSFYIDEDYIIFSDEGEQLLDYNIYKFAFKCKEFALAHNYSMSSYTTRDGGKCGYYTKTRYSVNDGVKRGTSEMLAIIATTVDILNYNVKDIK